MQPSTRALADRLHSASIHLLRRLREVDREAPVSAARLSVLSVLVFAPQELTVGELATAEQVRQPTMTRLVQGLEAQGLVRRRSDPDDARRTRVEVTARGRRVLERARARRVRMLAERLAPLGSREREALARAAELLERVSRA